MFDRLLKSKFYAKCKSAIKVAKTRIDAIQRRRNAMQKFLRSDIAHLLKNGSNLDFNAYGRAEGLVNEINLSSCYEYLKQSIECISTHLSAMNLQKECPDECREAVASVIFAAARFADLPELRTLRSLFTERYGDPLESYVNREFMEKLNLSNPTKYMKLQLMQEIAEENGIEWDSKSLEQKLFKTPHEQDLYNDDSNYQIPQMDHEKNLEDFTMVETYNNKKHYKSIKPHHVKQEVSTDETSSESSTASPRWTLHARKDNHHRDDKLVQAKTKPKSVRRGHRKSTSDDTDPSGENRVENLGLKLLLSEKKSLSMGKYCVDGSDDFTSPTESRRGTKTSGHVHPNLPDYDDFVARFNALKGK